jgi:hypothetical protein
VEPTEPSQSSPELHPDLGQLAWLVGTWRGAGVGDYPTIESFQFGQELVISHIGKPWLSHVSRSWALDPSTGEPTRPLAVETGFWRMVPDSLDAELLLAHPTGYVEIWTGHVFEKSIELITDLVGRTATAKEMTAGKRMYGIVEGVDLGWVYEMSAMGQALQPHLSARLKRDGDAG